MAVLYVEHEVFAGLEVVENLADFQADLGGLKRFVGAPLPFDHEVLFESVKKTAKLILASDACERGSYLHTIAGQIAQIAFDHLDAPVCVVGANNGIVPPAELEKEYFPQPAWLLDAYHAQIKPLPGYQPSTERTAAEFVRQSKYGVL
ncbi:MAG TPA: transketolase C-terminal domain-containing protein [Candidatus Bathyarchaeia archaeon]|nr:transketolase C-terminal domain-containing protein [Candidatus Bathyarchaeia archaeon]